MPEVIKQPASDSLRLLKLMFSPSGEPAGQWKEIFAGLEDEPPDQTVYQLLPLFAGQWKMQHAGLEIPTILAGIRRKGWYNHQKTERAFSRLLGIFQQAGIRTLILGDMAAAKAFYNDAFDRPVHEFTLMLDFDQAEMSIKLLEANGWEPLFELPVVNWEYLPGLRFARGGECQLHLRWHALAQCCFPSADVEFWDRAQPITCGEVATLALDPTSELLYLVSELSFSSPDRTGLLLADTLMLIQKEGVAVDWQHLLNQSRQSHLLLPLKTLVEFLKLHFETHLPSDFIEKLSNTPVNALERLEARYPRMDADQRIPGLLPILYFDYRRQRDRNANSNGANGFGDYLALYWRLDSRRALVATFWRLTWRRLKKMLTRNVPAHTAPEVASDA